MEDEDTWPSPLVPVPDPPERRSGMAGRDEVTRRLIAVERAIMAMREDSEEMARVIRGPSDPEEAKHRPGLVSIAYTLYSERNQRRAVTGFLLSVVGLLGATNVIVIVFVVIRVIGGGEGP